MFAALLSALPPLRGLAVLVRLLPIGIMCPAFFLRLALACTGFRCFIYSYMSGLAFGLEQYPPGECRTLLHFATSGYRLKLGSALLRLLLGAGVFDLIFLTCLVRLHKSKTLLPSLLFRFAFFLFFSSLVRSGPPAPPGACGFLGFPGPFPASAPASPCPSPSSPCVGLPHRAYAPVHALNSYLLSHASSWLFLSAPVLPFELMGPLYSFELLVLAIPKGCFSCI